MQTNRVSRRRKILPAGGSPPRSVPAQGFVFRVRRRGQKDVTGRLLSRTGTHRWPHRRTRLRGKRACAGSEAKSTVRTQWTFRLGFGVPKRKRSVTVPCFSRSDRVNVERCSEANACNVRACVLIGWVGGIHDASEKRIKRSARVGGWD